mgnify:CR=1 FL=1
MSPNPLSHDPVDVRVRILTGCRAEIQGPWLAAGGSLLWDPSQEQRQVASLRVGAIAQPAPGQQITVGFDEKGFLSGSFKAAVSA